jgi:hypothetical protein
LEAKKIGYDEPLYDWTTDERQAPLSPPADWWKPVSRTCDVYRVSRNSVGDATMP